VGRGWRLGLWLKRHGRLLAYHQIACCSTIADNIERCLVHTDPTPVPSSNFFSVSLVLAELSANGSSGSGQAIASAAISNHNSARCNGRIMRLETGRQDVILSRHLMKGHEKPALFEESQQQARMCEEYQQRV